MMTTARFCTGLCVLLLASTAAFAAVSPFDADEAGREPPAPKLPVEPRPAPAAQHVTPEPAERVPTPNPLWAVPLKQLSITRDRPIFTPSRRPPQPPAVAAPAPPPLRPAPKPAAPERPTLSLVGTISGGREAIGIFVDQASRKPVRLRIGEGHEGWVLRSVQRAGAALQKGPQVVFVTFPPPTNRPGAGTPPPAGALTTAQPIPATPSPPLPAPLQSPPPQAMQPQMTPPVPGPAGGLASPTGNTSSPNPFAAPRNQAPVGGLIRPPAFKRPE
jgi:general secretion pathway protein N